MPKDRDSAVKQLCQKAQSLSNDAVIGARKISENFDLWGESLADSQMKQRILSACDKIKTEFSNYGTKYNTYAKLNNFHHTIEEIQELEKQIWIMNRIPEYLEFKNECGDIVNYISAVQNSGVEELKQQIEDARSAFRSARDSIADGTSGSDAARKVKEVLEPVQQRYIDLYYEAHKKKRLDIEGATKGNIQESIQLKNLKKLHAITILPGAKLTDFETSIANIKVCYELTPTELKCNPFCPHCDFRLDKAEPNVNGRLNQIEEGV